MKMSLGAINSVTLPQLPRAIDIPYPTPTTYVNLGPKMRK